MNNCTIFNDVIGQNVSIPCNHVVGSPNLATGEVTFDSYKYLVTPASAYTFTALFGVAALAHGALAVYWRRWFTLATLAFGTAVEAVGWGGRVWSTVATHWNPDMGGLWVDSGSGITMQIVCLIIAPTFFSAANYILLGRIIMVIGPQYSSLSPKSFSVLFTFADFVCLVIQGVGGGYTGSSDELDDLTHGLRIMAVGVILQMVITVIFVVALAETTIRYWKSRPTSRSLDLLRPFAFLLKWRSRKVSASTPPSATPPGSMELGLTTDATDVSPRQKLGFKAKQDGTKHVTPLLAALFMTSTLILVRSVYRADELITFNGVSGGAYANQPLFIGMDATLMFLLVLIYLVIHPGLLDGRRIA